MVVKVIYIVFVNVKGEIIGLLVVVFGVIWYLLKKLGLCVGIIYVCYVSIIEVYLDSLCVIFV